VYGVLKNMVFQSFTAETAEFAEKTLENSAFSRVLCGEKVLSHMGKPSMYVENTMQKAAYENQSFSVRFRSRFHPA
jgi:hypothetical protein